MPIRTFETRGPVNPSRHYVVPRTEEIVDLGKRIKDGRYIVIFAPRQTGKTTFFRWTLDSLDESYLPIQLNFEDLKIDLRSFITKVRWRIENADLFQQSQPDRLPQFLIQKSLLSGSFLSYWAII